jgi:isopentenyl-diphosphate delta-isomerase
MDYYKQKIYLAAIDKNDKIVRKVERWQAHKEGILHRGFTCILKYKSRLLLQHRRHPAFDGFFDLSFSSHPTYINGKLQTMEVAIYNTLKREWNLQKEDLKTKIKFLDKFYYKACDPKSPYTEHEIDYLYFIEINRLPKKVSDFYYNYKLVRSNDLKIKNWKLKTELAPWVKQIIESKSSPKR